MSIEVQSLTKIYGEQKAVDDISFKINKGEIVGFLGPNGAGKSTTMKIITGYLKSTAGTALVAGVNVALNPKAVKKKIGYLPESNALYPDMYVKEYLGFIASVHALPHPQKAVAEAIETVGLTIEQHKKIGQLSKGYKQRVGLAAALIHNPEVLVLDEPASGLDPNQIVEIREVIKKQGQNKTVLFSSHIMQEVEAVCERVMIINRGKIVANEKLSTLQQNTGMEVIQVTFSQPVAQHIIGLLQQVAHIRSSNPATWHITTAHPDAVRNQLLQLAVSNSLSIVSMQSEVHKLEQVFKELTTGGGVN